MKEIKLNVEGMGCQHCVDTITEAVEQLAGIQSVKVDLEAGTVTVQGDQPMSTEVIKDAIEDAGYDIKQD